MVTNARSSIVSDLPASVSSCLARRDTDSVLREGYVVAPRIPRQQPDTPFEWLTHPMMPRRPYAIVPRT